MTANDPSELQRIYGLRFDHRLAYRNSVWKVLIRDKFQQYVRPDSVVLDLGCGYGEFINNIHCAKKYAMDLNPEARKRLNADVELLEQDCSTPWPLAENTLDVVFTSNFFEHLPSKAALKSTLEEAYRCLKPGGLLVAMGPNVRYLSGSYWDFWDHHLALTDLSLGEGLENCGFTIAESVARFLPYTMVNAREYPVFFISAYLRFPLAWKFMGRQFLIAARK